MSGPSLAPIVRALGGDLHSAGRRANVPGPGHSTADRSVSLRLSGNRVLIHCFAGDDWRAVLRDLQQRGLVDADGRIGSFSPSARETDRPSPAARIRTAQQIWSEGRALVGTASGRYLARRGVELPNEGLRHHPGLPAAVYTGRGPRRAALLAAIREPHRGVVVGVEITYLTADGARAAVALPRKTIGLVPSGAAVRLSPPSARMLVGEGVFTCLSAAAKFDLACWALLSSGNLGAWRPPTGVRSVLIAADRGAAGEAAASRLAERLRAAGTICRVRLPPPSFGDWNEAAAVARPSRT